MHGKAPIRDLLLPMISTGWFQRERERAVGAGRLQAGPAAQRRVVAHGAKWAERVG